MPVAPQTKVLAGLADAAVVLKNVPSGARLPRRERLGLREQFQACAYWRASSSIFKT